MDGQNAVAGEQTVGSSAVTSVLHVAVVGAGAFGRNHLRVWHELSADAASGVQLVALVDASEAIRSAAEQQYGVPGFATVEALCAAMEAEQLSVQLASVAVPTVHHRAAAELLLAAGVDVLIEKPLAPSLEDADAILATAAQYGRMVQVGHLERFNPAVVAVRPLLDRAMFFESHRLSIFTPRSLDVDVVLDLMIHDLDIVLSMVPSPVREVRAVGLPVLSRKVDIANVRLEFENGCVANFTASRVSTERVRKLRFFQPQQYLSLDFARQDVLLIDVKAAAAGLAAGLAAGMNLDAIAAQVKEHPSAGLSLRTLDVAAGEPLRMELVSFLNAVRTRTRPVVSGEDGRAALALALQITEAIAEHQVRAGL